VPWKSPALWRAILPGVLIPLATACGASEEDVQAEFNAFVADHDDCQAATDCALISPGCPLGCSVALRADAVDEAEAFAKDLIEDYERGGASCDYGCTGAQRVACTDEVCQICPDLDGGTDCADGLQ
jgi:hypothetical protein